MKLKTLNKLSKSLDDKAVALAMLVIRGAKRSELQRVSHDVVFTYRQRDKLTKCEEE